MHLGATQNLFNNAVPRDEAYYGDPGTNYTYSRRQYKPLAWHRELLFLKTRVEDATPAVAHSNSGLARTGYNAVLCNLYRNGNDSVGLHGDAEPEMVAISAEPHLPSAQSDGLADFNSCQATCRRIATIPRSRFDRSEHLKQRVEALKRCGPTVRKQLRYQ
ncbi:MAG TPA: hypothetical protein VMT20_21695 [Terriglobia bacterium]|nr:hypothetical protein [Terriglobia bacterium]